MMGDSQCYPKAKFNKGIPMMVEGELLCISTTLPDNRGCVTFSALLCLMRYDGLVLTTVMDGVEGGFFAVRPTAERNVFCSLYDKNMFFLMFSYKP